MPNESPDASTRAEQEPLSRSGEVSRKMGEKAAKILVTSALPYINNVPHLGHIAGCHLPADIYVRYLRLAGEDVVFVGGSDEHGTPSEIAAKNAGIPLADYQDHYHAIHKAIYGWFGISYDNYSRTSKEGHAKVTQDVFERIRANGYIEEKKVKMFYDEEMGQFLVDRYVRGKCPKCGYEDAGGDQCDKCGSMLDPTELINPISALTKKAPILKETNHLYLRLDKLSDRLRDWLAAAPFRDKTKNEGLGWVKLGLEPRSITRDLKNGVPVPGYEGKVFYVWFDAPIGYLSIAAEADPAGWAERWSAQGRVVHFLGKDNIPFHTIFWPGILLADGRYSLPSDVVGLRYLNYEGQKFSKSRGIGVFCEHLSKSDVDPDIFRAYLSYVLPEVDDTEFSWADFERVVNNEFIAKFANLAHRSASIVHAKLGRKTSLRSDPTEADRAFVSDLHAGFEAVRVALSEKRFRDAVKRVLELCTRGNQYMNDAAPWADVKKGDLAAAGNSLHFVLYASKLAAVALSPFLPLTSRRVLAQLGLDPDVALSNGSWDEATKMDNAFLLPETPPAAPMRKITPEYLEYVKEIATRKTTEEIPS